MVAQDQNGQKTSTEAVLTTRRTPGAEPLETGVWYSDFLRVKAEAEKTGKPLFAMWINPGCGFCKRFCENVLTTRFGVWMKGSGMLFWLGSQSDPEGRGGPGWDFVVQQSKGMSPHTFPLCAVWQSVNGKVVHDHRTSGKVLEQEKSGEEALSNVLAAIDQARKDPPHVIEPFNPGGTAPKADPQQTKVLQQIAALVAPFAPQAKAAAPVSALRIRINPALDEDKRLRFLRSLAEHEGHCPCQAGKTAATVCLCAEFMAQAKPGVCKCGFYEKYTPTKEN